MASTFSWIFGKKKPSAAAQAEEAKPAEDDFVMVNNGSTTNDDRPCLYPIINPDSIPLRNDSQEPSETRAHDNVHVDVAHYLSGVPFQIASSVISNIDIADIERFLYLTKRTTNINNLGYDFSLEFSVINE